MVAARLDAKEPMVQGDGGIKGRFVDAEGRGLSNVAVYLISRPPKSAENEHTPAAPAWVTILDGKLSRSQQLVFVQRPQELMITNIGKRAERVSSFEHGTISLAPGESATLPFPEDLRFPTTVEEKYRRTSSFFVLARSNSYMTGTQADGTFNLTLPAGKCTVRFWHDDYGYLITPQFEVGRVTLDTPPRKTIDLGVIRARPLTADQK
jgi:hypothetical protein